MGVREESLGVGLVRTLGLWIMIWSIRYCSLELKEEGGKVKDAV